MYALFWEVRFFIMIKRHLITKTTAVVLAAVLMSAPAFSDAALVDSRAQEVPADGSLASTDPAFAGELLSEEEEEEEADAAGTGAGDEGAGGGMTDHTPGTGSSDAGTGAGDGGMTDSGTSDSGITGTGDTTGTGSTDQGNPGAGDTTGTGSADQGTTGTGTAGAADQGASGTAATDGSGNAATGSTDAAEGNSAEAATDEAVTDSSAEDTSDEAGTENTEEETDSVTEEETETETENAEEADPEAEDADSEVLTPEQENALAEEDAEQESQSRFDEHEAYNPELFSFTTDWRGWKQGSSAWYSMRNYGCRMTAYSKLLRATGIENPGHFSPDSFFRWCRNNGWLAGTIREIGTPGNCAIAYAEAKGRKLVREEAISLFKSSDPEKRKQEIIDKINEGYYVILCSSAHFVYVDEMRTRLTQELWVDDSINGDNVYKVDRYVFQGSLADWENSDPRKNWHYRYFSVEEPDEVAEPPHVTDVSIHSFNREEGYYTLDATVSSDASQIDRVMFPTWTAKDDKDDLNPEWEYGTASEGYLVPALSDENESVYRFYVRMSDHNNEAGKYFTYVYAYGRDGQRSAPGTITVPLRPSSD